MNRKSSAHIRVVPDLPAHIRGGFGGKNRSVALADLPDAPGNVLLTMQPVPVPSANPLASA